MLRFNKEVLVKAYQGVLVQALLVEIPCYRINKECPCWDFNKDSLLSLTRSFLLSFQQGHSLLSLTESLRRSSSYRLWLKREVWSQVFRKPFSFSLPSSLSLLSFSLSLSLIIYIFYKCLLYYIKIYI